MFATSVQSGNFYIQMRKDTTKRKLMKLKLNVQCFQTQLQSPPHFGLLFQAGRGREGPIVLPSILQIPECHTGRGSAVWERNGGRRKEGGGEVREDGV